MNISLTLDYLHTADTAVLVSSNCVFTWIKSIWHLLGLSVVVLSTLFTSSSCCLTSFACPGVSLKTFCRKVKLENVKVSFSCSFTQWSGVENNYVLSTRIKMIMFASRLVFAPVVVSSFQSCIATSHQQRLTVQLLNAPLCLPASGWLLSGAEQVVYTGFVTAFSQLTAAAGNEADESSATEPVTGKLL